MEKVTLADESQIPVLGLAAFAAEEPARIADAIAEAIDCGIRRFDVSELYGNARHVGQAIKASGVAREDVWITVTLWTKGRSYQDILDAYQCVLYELGLDRADACILHACLDFSSFADQWTALEQLKRSGQVRTIGTGRCALVHLQDLLQQCQIIPALYQDEISPFTREEKTLHYLNDNNVTVSTSNCTRDVTLASQSMIAQLASELHCTAPEVCYQWASQHQMLFSITHCSRDEMELAVQVVRSPRFILSPAQVLLMNSLNETER